MIDEYNVRLETFLQQGILEPEFYGDLVYGNIMITKVSFPNLPNYV